MPGYCRLHIDGSMGDSPERFSTSIGVQVVGDLPGPAGLTTWVEEVADILAGSSAGAVWLRGNLGLTSEIDRIRAYSYPTTTAPAASQAVNTDVIPGSGTISKPPQCATVVSLITNQPGGSYRGRMYIPALTAAVGQSLKRTDVSQSTADNFAALLSAICNPVGALGIAGPAVVSPSKDAVTPVTRIRIGDVVDTQRRRRDALVETYRTADVP